MRVMIVDDSIERASGWAEDLVSSGSLAEHPDVPDSKAISDAMTSLNLRRRTARGGGDWRKLPCLFDGVDLLLLDFDLIDFADDRGKFSTGEELAYLARLFSTAGLVCVINQFGLNKFDLTLKGDISGHADLNLGSEQITNQGLWHPPGRWTSFRPWHWPVLPMDVDELPRRHQFVRENLDAPLLATFGFDEGGGRPERKLAADALIYFQSSPGALTLRGAANSSSFVHPRDADWLATDVEQLVRVNTAVITKWLRRYVAIRQDTLVDLAHLVSRKPWLLQNAEDRAQWESTIASPLSVTEVGFP